MEKKWEELSVDEKQELMFQKWLSPKNVSFFSPEAEKAYKQRVTRIKDAIQLKKRPDMIPVCPMTGFFPAYYAGYTPEDVMYDYEKLSRAFSKFVLDLKPDGHGGPMVAAPGRLFEILDYRLYAWPGHGVPPEISYQCIEGEYMKADEYDILIQDPTYFFTSVYFPRIFGALEPLKKLPALTSILEIYGGFSAVNFIPFGLPDVQAAYQALFKAGEEALKWISFVGPFGAEMAAAGFPEFMGGGCKAPFDVIGDTLRGTKGIMLDMYRQPGKLLQALEATTPLAIKMGVSAAKMNGNPVVFIPLHKGADGFLSDKQFKEFYWPTLKKVMIGLINEGCVPFPWAEGGYNSRLDVIGDIPRGKVIWGFDATDMVKVKEKLGGVACIGGNIPADVLTLGTTQDIQNYIKKLIDSIGRDGGYIMMNGSVIEDVKPENVKTMIDFTHEYGVYK